MSIFKVHDNSSMRGPSFCKAETFCEGRAGGELSQKVLELEDLR